MSSEMSRGATASHWLRRIASRIEAALRHLLRPPRARVPNSSWPSWQIAAVVAVCAIAAFVVLMVMVDAAAITAARKLPSLIVAGFDAITDFGKSGWFLFPLGALIVAIALAPTGLPHFAQLTLAVVMTRAGFLFVAIGLPSLFTTIVKRIIGRARPFVSGVADPYVFHPFATQAAYASLPSGHATTAFAAAIAIGALWPRARTLVWIYAGLIVLSRVVITAHHPSDVFAGALVGGFGALAVRNYFAARRLAFGLTPQGEVFAYPGPSLRRLKAVARSLLSE